VLRIDAAGTTFAVSDTGEGPAVVLVHAGVADRRMWDAVADRLPGHRAIRHDLRGFGTTAVGSGRFSHRGDLLALLDALGVERATLVGSSFGGLVALEAAALAPERFDRLVLLAPPLPDHAWSPEFAAFAAAEDAALEAGDLGRAVQVNVDQWVPNAGDRHRAYVAAAQRRAFELQLAADLEEEDLDPPVTERLADVAMPVRVLVGSRDLADFRAIAERLARALPDAALQEIAGAGHLLPLERPDEVAAAIAG
jgi:pimeloyl-ACP methyl ester carboxylesterase